VNLTAGKTTAIDHGQPGSEGARPIPHAKDAEPNICERRQRRRPERAHQATAPARRYTASTPPPSRRAPAIHADGARKEVRSRWRRKASEAGTVGRICHLSRARSWKRRYRECSGGWSYPALTGPDRPALDGAGVTTRCSRRNPSFPPTGTATDGKSVLPYPPHLLFASTASLLLSRTVRVNSPRGARR